MLARFCVCALVCLLNQPALSDETWDCKFNPDDSAPRASEARLVIAGGGIDWQSPVPSIELPNGLKLKSVSFKYRVLEDNDAGVVGIGALPPRRDANGLALTGTIVLLSKADGRIRVGVIGMDAHKVHDGQCAQTRTPSPAN